MKTMFVYLIVGAVLTSAGVSFTDWQFYVVLVALVVNYLLGVSNANPG